MVQCNIKFCFLIYCCLFLWKSKTFEASQKWPLLGPTYCVNLVPVWSDWAILKMLAAKSHTKLAQIFNFLGGYFEKCHEKTVVATFWTIYGKNWQLFIPSSGHTAWYYVSLLMPLVLIICRKASYDILSSMNTFNDPCEDFYEVICGYFCTYNSLATKQLQTDLKAKNINRFGAESL